MAAGSQGRLGAGRRGGDRSTLLMEMKVRHPSSIRSVAPARLFQAQEQRAAVLRQPLVCSLHKGQTEIKQGVADARKTGELSDGLSLPGS